MNGLELRSIVELPAAEGYVVETWLASFRRSESEHRSERERPQLSRSAWTKAHRAVIKALLPLAWVAVRPGSETVHAWVCGVPGVLHYVYVPPELRGKGFARWMVGEICGETGVASHRSRRPFPGFVFSPFAMAEAMR